MRNLSQEFRGEKGNPDNLIALVPTHEWEISVGEGAGDYNPAMIAGFREQLLSLYGSIDNINERFWN